MTRRELALRPLAFALALGAVGCGSEGTAAQPVTVAPQSKTLATVLTFATFGRACTREEIEDANHNGIIDAGEDSNENGVLDPVCGDPARAAEDTNENGILDPGEDCDGDGQLRCWKKGLLIGQAEAVDVDGIVSTGNDLESCGKVDLMTPEGTPGVDNQFEELVGMVEGLEGPENVNALLEGAIRNGQLLILMVVDGVDDPLNDPEVSVRMGAGLGTPLLDNVNTILPYQTFGFNTEETPVSPMATASIVDGVLTAGPADVVLPVRVLDANFNLRVNHARARMVVEYDPLGGGIGLSGIVGGGVSNTELEGIVQGLNVSQQIQSAVGPFVRGLADLDPDADGRCQRISAMLKIRSTSAFLLEE